MSCRTIKYASDPNDVYSIIIHTKGNTFKKIDNELYWKTDSSTKHFYLILSEYEGGWHQYISGDTSCWIIIDFKEKYLAFWTWLPNRYDIEENKYQNVIPQPR